MILDNYLSTSAEIIYNKCHTVTQRVLYLHFCSNWQDTQLRVYRKSVTSYTPVRTAVELLCKRNFPTLLRYTPQLL